MRLVAVTLDSADIDLDLTCFAVKIKEERILLAKAFYVTFKTE